MCLVQQTAKKAEQKRFVFPKKKRKNFATLCLESEKYWLRLDVELCVSWCVGVRANKKKGVHDGDAA